MATRANFEPDGSCHVVDAVDGREHSWPTLADWATDWFAEWRTSDYADASDFIHAACDDAVPGVVGALLALAEAAGEDATELSWIGAGPLEDFLWRTENGPHVVQEILEAARRSPALRIALGAAVMPDEVTAQLSELGVRLPASQRPASAD